MPIRRLCVLLVLLLLGAPSSALSAPLTVEVPATDSSTEPWLEGLEGATDIELTTFPDGNLSKKRARELVRALEGRTLKTLRFRRFESSADALAVVVAAAGLARVSAIEVLESPLSVDAFRALTRGAFRGVRFVKLDAIQLRDDHLAALASSPTFAQVEWLSLTGNQFGANGVAAIAASEHLGSLGALQLDGNALGLAAATAIANARLPKLTDLSLRRTELDDQALSALVTGRLAKQLTRLDVRDNAFTRDGVGAIASSGQVALTRPPLLEPALRSAWDAGTIRAGGVAEELSGDIVAAFAEDLDALQGVRRLQGSLTVTGEVASLAALLNLEEIGGSLIIRDTRKLRSLEGLGALKRVGAELVISGNDGLSSLNGVEGLEEVGGSLLIPGAEGESNPKLRAVAGFPALRRVNGSVMLQGDAGRPKSVLRKVAGFSALESVEGDVVLSGIEANKVGPFPALRTIGGDLRLVSSRRLATVSGFNALTEIAGSFVVEDCAKLRRLSGLGVLARVGGDLRLCYPTKGKRARQGLEKRFRGVEVGGTTVTECE